MDSGDTATDSGGGGGSQGRIPASLAFTDYTPARGAVWSLLTTDGERLYAGRTDTRLVYVSDDLGATWDPVPGANGDPSGGGAGSTPCRTRA